MQFTRIPPSYAPLGGRIDYAVAHDAAATLTIRFIDTADGTIVGAKRFVNVREAAFDAAPYLRPLPRFTPATGPTGVYPATGRTVRTKVEATLEPDPTGAAAAGAEVGAGTGTNRAAAADGPSGGSGTGQSAADGCRPERTDTNATATNATDAKTTSRVVAEAAGAEAGANRAPAADGPTSGSGTGQPAADGCGPERTDTNATATNATDAKTTNRVVAQAVRAEAGANRTEGEATSAEPEKTAAADRATASETGRTAEGEDPAAEPGTSGTADQSAAATVSGPILPISVITPARTFLAASEAVAPPAILTTMPAARLLPDGASDELTLLTAATQSVTVIARSGDTTTAVSYPVSGEGLHLFRLDARDFAGAETLTVDAGACGTIHYTLVAAPADGVRLAWRSSAGSVEAYTFPVETTAAVEATKSRAYGPDGHIAAARQERRRTLRSAFEVRAVLEALAELTASPEVWLVTPAGYEAVDVVSERAVVHRHGTLSCLEIEIRPRRKTRLPWS